MVKRGNRVILGLTTSIPLYYFYGNKGIVPAMIISAITALILSWYYSKKIVIEKVELSIKNTFLSGISMAKLGISMTLAGFLAVLSSYILNAFISNRGGVEQVGLYLAGWGVVGQYTGIIFTAMATDYYPRLSAIHSDNDKVKELVKQQGESALLIMTPLLALLIVTMPIVIKILYTSDFSPVIMFANLTVLGMPFKAVSWSMGYVYLAKGDAKTFLSLEIISGVLALLLNIAFYFYYGINGLGISFFLSYFIGVFLTYYILNKKYRFSFSSDIFIKFFKTYIFIIVSFLTVFIPTVVIDIQQE
jgi:O-antigen/teichoic acid export membrane protein